MDEVSAGAIITVLTTSTVNHRHPAGSDARGWFVRSDPHVVRFTPHGSVRGVSSLGRMSSETTTPTEAARYRYGVVMRHENPEHLELAWLATTTSMSDEDWKTGLMLLATEAEATGTASILIDATEFRHDFNDREGSMAWRDDHVIPRYNRAGVTRFAFVMPAGFPGPTAESGSEPRIDGHAAAFPTQWFLGRDAALAWLGEAR